MKTTVSYETFREVDIPESQIIRLAAKIVLDQLNESLQLQDRVSDVFTAMINPPFCRLAITDDHYPHPSHNQLAIRVTESEAYLAAAYVTLRLVEKRV